MIVPRGDWPVMLLVKGFVVATLVSRARVRIVGAESSGRAVKTAPRAL